MKLCLNCHKQFADEVELCPHEGSYLVPLPSDPLLGALIDERYRVESLSALKPLVALKSELKLAEAADSND